jgi:hypothetical protein
MLNKYAYNPICVLLLFSVASLSAQEVDVVWNTGVHSFFDNTEFGGSAVQMPQTMAGVHLVPEIGLSRNARHQVFAGLDIMHEYGSTKAIDFYDPLLYYAYTGGPFRFYAGAFPRRNTLDRYPRMFFQDSIMNYRPVVNGVFWEYREHDNYANVWLDWASRQTYTRHEAFFMGWSGRYHYGPLYLQHFGYMYHFAGVMEPVVKEGLHDNGLILTSLGVDLSGRTPLVALDANIGWSMGLERDRDLGVWHRPQGILAEARIEYQGLGAFNTYYRGGAQQVFYGDHGNQLYWGDPIYRSTAYNRTDLYVQFIKTHEVTLKFVYSLHFTEGQMYHEQAFYATFDLSNFNNKKHEKKYQYLWDKWF